MEPGHAQRTHPAHQPQTSILEEGVFPVVADAEARTARRSSYCDPSVASSHRWTPSRWVLRPGAHLRRPASRPTASLGDGSPDRTYRGRLTEDRATYG